MSNDHKMRTPLKNVRRLGSAKEGADHFWTQRVSAIANLSLVPILLMFAFSIGGSDYVAIKRTLTHPVVAVLLVLFIASSLIHMRLGMQTIIEDYVRRDRQKVPMLMMNTFFSIFIGAICVWAMMKLNFGT
jgi:succinate dehydrogenase / fumarate reductase, membrane anchor subunit